MIREITVNWNEMILRLGGEPLAAGRLFNLITDSYSQQFRSYHTLGHIGDCLKKFAEVQGQLDHPEAVEYAIWFHDIVCAPGSQSNEYLSAASAVYAAKELGFTPAFRRLVDKMILLTSHQDIAVKGDAAYFLDIDMAVLGRDWLSFLEYERQIRAEYRYLSELEYKLSRRKVLGGFLVRSAIFHTTYFRDKYEFTARENLADLVTMLGKGH